MNKLLTIMLSVRLQKMFFVGLFLIVSSIFSLYALTYEECFEIERTKGQKEGASFQESMDYAKTICESKNKNTSKEKSTSTTTTTSKIYVGTSTNITGNIKLNASNDLDFYEDKDEITRKTGLKVGIRFSSWRASLQSHTFSAEVDNCNFVCGIDNCNSDCGYKINLNLVIFDYLHPSGFFVGGGTGTGKVVGNISSEGGKVTAFNIGYEFTITPHLLIGLGHLNAPFSYTVGATTITFTTSSTYADISYLF